MKKLMNRSPVLLLAAVLVGCAAGGVATGQTVEDVVLEETHETYLPEHVLNGDFSVTYECYVENKAGALDASELEFDLVYDVKTLHMPLLDGDTYITLEDGTIHEFSAKDRAKGRKEAGSVYSSNKVPSNGVELRITLGRSGDVISGEATYEGGAMGKGNHQFWIFHYYSDVKLPEEMTLKVTGQNVNISKIKYVVE